MDFFVVFHAPNVVLIARGFGFENTVSSAVPETPVLLGDEKEREADSLRGSGEPAFACVTSRQMKRSARQGQEHVVLPEGASILRNLTIAKHFTTYGAARRVCQKFRQTKIWQDWTLLVRMLLCLKLQCN